MRVFAIDPGTTYSAYCVFDNIQKKLLDFAKLPNREALTKMIGWLEEADIVVIERMQSYRMGVGQEVFETCEWIGRFSQEAEKKLPVEYIYRPEEKAFLCKKKTKDKESKTTDSNIRQALINMFAQHDLKNGKGTKKNPDFFYGVSNDVWSAIAVAVTWLGKREEKERTNGT